MRRLIRKIMFACLVFITAAVAETGYVYAAGNEQSIVYDNNDTQYRAVIDDGAAVLTDDEKQKLLEEMKPLTEYSDIFFRSTDENEYDSTADYAMEYYRDNIGEGCSGTLFVVDMKNRQLYIFSDADALDVITGSYAEAITDNVYDMAHNGDYYGCASQAFSQMYSLWNGQPVATPMKHICCALLAVIISMFATIFVMLRHSMSAKATEKALLDSIKHSCTINGTTKTLTSTEKKYVSSSDGGGDSFGGGGDSFGGGGGHGF